MSAVSMSRRRSKSRSVLRWKREDPLMQYVELGELRLSKALLLDKDPEAIDLVSSPETPLIAYKDIGAVRRYFVGFSPTVESNWWMQPSLLIFLQNLVRSDAGAALHWRAAASRRRDGGEVVGCGR